MKHKSILFIAILLVSILLVSCSTPEQVTSVTNNEAASGSSANEVSTGAGTSSDSLSEYDRYLKVETENACNLLEASKKDDPAAVMEAMGEYETIAGKYGFTMEEASALVEKYKNDEQFQLDALDELQKTCPDLLEAAAQS